LSGPACGICSNPALSLAIATLRGEGLTIEKIADRVKRPPSSVQRHLRHADTGRKRERRGGRPRKSDDCIHCSHCGFVTTAVDAQGLLKRAERLLWIAEGIASQAQSDNDARLTLAAVEIMAYARTNTATGRPVWEMPFDAPSCRRLSSRCSTSKKVVALVVALGAYSRRLEPYPGQPETPEKSRVSYPPLPSPTRLEPIQSSTAPVFRRKTAFRGYCSQSVAIDLRDRVGSGAFDQVRVYTEHDRWSRVT
jgi:hypothetical protein